MDNDAFRFLQEAAGKPDWTRTVTDGGEREILSLARDHGYGCGMDELKQVAREILKGTEGAKEVSRQDIKEASADSVGFERKGGYGSDSGFALMSGIAAAVLKK